MAKAPITKEGYEKLKKEVYNMENVQMPAIAVKIAEARAEGDLKENAEYHAQREKQGMLQAKINLIQSKLANAYIVDKSELPEGIVVFGSRVKVKDLDDDVVEEYELVGPGEEDYTGEVMKILSTSPLGQQFLHHVVGDKVEVETPGGVTPYEILGIN